MTEPDLQAIFDEYYAYVYTIVWNRLCGVGTREDAEECISDVFADVFAGIHDIREGTLRTWIATLANRTAIDRYRRLVKRSDVALDEELLAVIPDEHDMQRDTEEHLAKKALLDAVASLGEPDATIIMQKYYYGLRSDEIAKIVGLRSSTVRSRLTRAMKRLRGMLREEDFR